MILSQNFIGFCLQISHTMEKALIKLIVDIVYILLLFVKSISKEFHQQT